MWCFFFQRFIKHISMVPVHKNVEQNNLLANMIAFLWTLIVVCLVLIHMLMGPLRYRFVLWMTYKELLCCSKDIWLEIDGVDNNLRQHVFHSEIWMFRIKCMLNAISRMGFCSSFEQTFTKITFFFLLLNGTKILPARYGHIYGVVSFVPCKW